LERPKRKLTDMKNDARGMGRSLNGGMGRSLTRGAGRTLELRPVALAALACAALGAQAQTAPTGHTLQEVTVTGESLGSTTEHTGSYTTGATTLGKREQSLRETPQSISVITRQRLEDQNLRTLDEALSQTPGITVEMGHSFDKSFYSRGFQIDTVQFDGVPTQRGLSQGLNTGFYISPDLFAYDRVEVLRGPAGLFNGAGQPGGTVNLVRKRPLASRQFLGQVGVGSWNNRRVDADYNQPLNADGSVRARFVAAVEDREFYYDVSDNKRAMAYGIAEADLGPGTTVGAGLQYEKNDMVPYYAGLPRYSNGQDTRLPRETYLNAAWTDVQVETSTVFADIRHRFDADWKIKAGISRMKEDNDDLSGSNFGAINPATNAGFTLSSFRQKLVGEQTAADVTLDGAFNAFGRKHDLIAGVNWQARDYEVASQSMLVNNPAGGLNPFTFDSRDYAVAPTVPNPARAGTRTGNRVEQTGAYGSLRLALTEPVKLIVGGRFSQWKSAAVNLLTGAYTTQPYTDSGNFTPYAALTYDLDPRWTAYASYAEIYKSQATLFTWEGERLKPATGSNYEAGVKGSFAQGRLNAALALFRVTEENRSQVDPRSPASPTACPGSPVGGSCYVTEGKVRSQGLDAEIGGELRPGLQVAAGYTFNQTKYLQDRTATGAPSANEGQPLSTFTPRHILRLWSHWRLPGELSAWSVGGGVNVQSETYKTSGTVRFSQGGYAVWSARLGYRVSRNLNLALNVNNLFDKTYYRTIGLASGNWYGDPRNAMLTLQAAF
jgi:outer-membrane receptor for ferric coprogen and ferric-rhodotorulic acid